MSARGSKAQPDSKVIVVTGASRGLGRGLVDHYLGRGAIVVGCSRTPPTNSGLPDGYEHHIADVGDPNAIRAVFDTVRSRYGRLDALINNAGIASMNHVLLTSDSMVESVFRTNVFGCFAATQAAARVMRATGGRIVNVVSVAVPLKLAGEAAYVSSKAAVVSLTEVTARELAPFGITVNAVGPAPIDTDLVRNVPAEALDRLVAQLPISRYSTVEDVANVVDFFLDDRSDAVTGQVVFLGGA
jgi:3-oxoacyl-[acyl-carrier protein] reductase